MTASLCKVSFDKKENKIKKQFKETRQGISKFFQELFVYFRLVNLNLDYVPKLLKYSTKEHWFEISYVGESLDRILYRKSKRHLNSIIRELHERFKEDTQFYHNDIRYKNVCFNEENDKYYLIDFENCKFKFKDKNDNLILNDTYIRN
tara:strand:+ start:121 stop:564 length:444 start_codon:yes stop_codon:yes gene_type:complete